MTIIFCARPASFSQFGLISISIASFLLNYGSFDNRFKLSHIYDKDLDFDIQYSLSGSNTDGSFTVDESNPFFFSPYKILPIAQENKYLIIIFIFYRIIVGCVYSLESPHRGDSNEYTQHTIIVQKIGKNTQVIAICFLTWHHN